MTNISRVYFILYVRDQEASRVFYESVLGCLPSLHVPGMTEFTMADSTVIGLMPEQGIARLLDLDVTEVSRSAIRGEIYLVVPSPEEYHRRAIAAGAKELSALAPRDWGDQAAYSLDPNGYVLAFASPISKEM
jgi:catechol 2,3-dioxygenase-like lactoylglutathione lyase family enzyme